MVYDCPVICDDFWYVLSESDRKEFIEAALRMFKLHK